MKISVRYDFGDWTEDHEFDADHFTITEEGLILYVKRPDDEDPGGTSMFVSAMFAPGVWKAFFVKYDPAIPKQ